MHGLDIIILRNARAAGREAAERKHQGSPHRTDAIVRISANEFDRIEEQGGHTLALRADSAFIGGFCDEGG